MFKGPFEESIIKRAQAKKLVKIQIHNLRKWTKDKHQTVDDRPFGGGAGMILKIEPIYQALQALKNPPSIPKGAGLAKTKTLLLTPQGKTFNQKMAQKLSKEKHLILICGHYEGVDERVRQHLIDQEISIGDYILTGGELPAMVVSETIIRLLPGVLEKPEAIKKESFCQYDQIIKKTKEANRRKNQLKIRCLEYPQYTRPADFKGWKVPKILLSGDHQKIKDWQAQKALERTKKRRPDLL